METKLLGRTGLEVPIVGLGTLFVGSRDRMGGAGDLDEDLAAQTVVAAIEAGSTLIDTAPLYGGTICEKIIGRALRERPDLAAICTVTTKVGRLKEGMDYSYDAVMRSVAASQERLGLERFDLVYIHDATCVPMEEVMGTDRALGALRKLQDEGVVRFVGTAESNGPYIETGEFDAAEVTDAWSLLNQRAAERIFPAAERHHVGITVATPIERGLLAAGPIPGVEYLSREFSRECLEHVGRIQRLCEDGGIPLVAASLQWCTRHPLVATAIPGARNPEEATENATAGVVEITAAFWEALEPLVKHWEKGIHR